jgi:integration host factor subunit beta
MATITKDMIARELVEKYPDLTVDGAEIVINTILLKIIHSLKKDDKIELRGFGTFSSKMMPPRPVNNVHTGERLMLPEHRKIRFKPSRFIFDS